MNFLNSVLEYLTADLLSKFVELLDSLLLAFGLGKFIIALIVGINLTYFGLKSENISNIIVGFLFGLLLSKFMSYVIGIEWSHSSYYFPLAVFFSFLAYYIPRLTSAIIGVLISIFLVVILQIKVPLFILATIVLGGILGALSYSPMVIISTTFIGSISLLFVVINTIPILENGKLEWTSKTLLGILSLLGKHFFATMSLKAVTANVLVYSATFSIIFISGFIYQMKYWLGNSLHINDLMRAISLKRRRKYEPSFNNHIPSEKQKKIEPRL